MVRLPEGNLGVYVHVPYCLQKCRYCDFVSFEKAPEDAYFEKLCRDIRKAGEIYGERCESGKAVADTVFFGGGTPSLAAADQLGMVLDAIRESFELIGAGPGTGTPEISIEVNPETVTLEKATELKALGFGRVSMGVQSLDDDVLAAMDRVHSADRAREAFEILRGAGFGNINLDLMFGTPRHMYDGTVGAQDLETWHHTLDEIFAMRPEHISFYSLQLEEGTPMYEDYAAGRLEIPSWEENREMYHSAVGQLKEHGYHHYEVSNAALPGFECRHNLKYWNMRPYLGFGTSAHSFADGCRWEYGSDPHRETEAELKGDFIFTKLRLTDGFDPADYKEMFGSDFTAEFKEALETLASKGYIEFSRDSIRFTEKGLDNTNPVMEELLRAVRA